MDEAKINLVFDNVRNFWLAALLAAIGIGVFGLGAKYDLQDIYFDVIAIILIVTSIYLLLLNIKHASYILFSDDAVKNSISVRRKCAYGSNIFNACHSSLYIPYQDKYAWLKPDLICLKK